MIIYIYDGSFDGLLTSIYQAFYAKIKPDSIVREDEFIENFLCEKLYIKTDIEKSRRVYQAIEEKISHESLQRVFYTYLSELPDIGTLVLKYLQLAFKIGREVNSNLANEDVRNIDKIYRKVGRERHRITGILRFKKIKGDILYGQIEPDYNIIGLLAPHFEGRLKNENFIIHDKKRQIGVFYNKEEWVVKDIEEPDPFLVRETEEIYEDLWRTYFDSISIKTKTNPKLQKSNMPKRYWKYLTEKN